MTIATTQSEIPLLIHILGSTTDRVTALLAIAKAMSQTQTTSSGNNMLGYSTRCNEPWARYDPNQLVGTDSFEYHSDLADARWWQYVCTLVPPAIPPADTGQPPKSQVPVLTLNGREDPQDPPQNMAGAEALWPNSLQLAVPGQGHDIDPRTGACTAPIIQSFIDHGSTDHLDTTCLSALGPAPFALNLQALTSG